jgi:ribonuclease VapC
VTVLDASALLAFLFREPGHERVASVIGDCCISTVNLSEVVGRFARDGHDAREVARRVIASGIELVPFMENHACLAAALLPRTLAHGLSLGDRACLALAIDRGTKAMTADRAWDSVDVPVPIVQIRA